MAKLFYDNDADFSLLDGKTVAVIGFGSQGHAHALNLQNSGAQVIVGLRSSSSSWKAAEEQGLTVMTAADASREADVITHRHWNAQRLLEPLPARRRRDRQ